MDRATSLGPHVALIYPTAVCPMRPSCSPALGPMWPSYTQQPCAPCDHCMARTRCDLRNLAYSS